MLNIQKNYSYHPRVLESTVLKYLAVFPAVGITGPRQSGKSTLLLHLLQDYRYVTFDDLKMIEYFEEDPVGFMGQYQNKVIFDEVQNVPDLFHYIKMEIDKDRLNYGKFVLTASSQFAFLKDVSESLAGRIGLLTLLPFQFTEMPADLLELSVFKGSYPELVARKYLQSELWYNAYIDTYLHKDIRTLSHIGDLRDFTRFIRLLASNITCILNQSKFATILGVSVSTIKRWISVLEASYIIFLLPPYHKNFGKRIVKSSKIYFYDTGLVSYFTGIETKKMYEKGPIAGQLFENYIVSEVIKKEMHNKSLADLYYLRVSENVEIDLIIDRKQNRELIEIKKSSTFSIKMLKVVKQFMSEGDSGYLLYQGASQHLAKNLNALHYSEYLSGHLEAKF